MYNKLPEKLSIGDRIACPKHYPEPCVYEVMKVDGGRVWLANEAGLILNGNLTVELLRGYDYELCVEVENDT